MGGEGPGQPLRCLSVYLKVSGVHQGQGRFTSSRLPSACAPLTARPPPAPQPPSLCGGEHSLGQGHTHVLSLSCLGYGLECPPSPGPAWPSCGNGAPHELAGGLGKCLPRKGEVPRGWVGGAGFTTEDSRHLEALGQGRLHGAVLIRDVCWSRPGRKWHLQVGSREGNLSDVSLGKEMLWCPAWA